jgi:hypothetical protein
MKRLAIVLMTLIWCWSLVSAQEAKGTKEAAMDKEEIIKTTLDYLEGWYEGNAERMERALHPDLAKMGLKTVGPTGKSMLTHASATNMVEWTRAGYGKLKEGEEANIDITVLDVYDNTASVKAISLRFVDYVLLARYNGRWAIVNVLWEPVRKVEEDSGK